MILVMLFLLMCVVADFVAALTVHEMQPAVSAVLFVQSAIIVAMMVAILLFSTGAISG